MLFKKINDKKGFTLLEILVAIALFAALTAMLYPAYIGTFRNTDITESYGTIYKMSRIAMERISEDLECACIPKTGDNLSSDIAQSQVFSGKDSTIDGRDADDLQFVSEKHLSFNSDKTAGRGVIKYYLKQYGDEEGLTLYRSDDLELGNKSEDETGLVLCEGLTSMNISYQDENGDTYDYWDSSSEPFKGKLPAMASIELEFLNKYDPESPVKFITSVVIPLAKREYGNNS